MIGHLEEAILITILRLEKAGEETFGLAVFNKLKEMGFNIVNGSVYNTLDRLETKGLLHSENTTPIAQKGGRRKRIYFLEKKGLEVLQGCLEEKKSKISKLEMILPKHI